MKEHPDHLPRTDKKNVILVASKLLKREVHMSQHSLDSMNIVILQQGDPNSITSAGSGSPYYLARALERQSVNVTILNCEPRGMGRIMLAGRTIAFPRRRWVSRFNIAPSAFITRSKLAVRELSRVATPLSAIIQYGSSFHPNVSVPLYCFSDNFVSNTINEPLSWYSQLLSGERRRLLELESQLFNGSEGIFSFSQQTANAFHSKLKLDREKVLVTYPGPNFYDVPNVNYEQKSIVPTVLFIGRAWEDKGGPLLLKAFDRVRQSLPDARLVVIGPKSVPNLPDFVDFEGFLDKDNPRDMERLTQRMMESWVFCLPTMYESFGMAFVEAMWFGMPTIGTDGWAIPEIIEHGVTGFRTPLGDISALSTHIVEILSNDVLRLSMGRSARARAERLFSWDVTAKAMIRRIYEDRLNT